MTSDATLISLAMLKVNADTEGRDYIDYLIPFAASVLYHQRPDPVFAADTRVLLSNEFGLMVSERACELVLKRLARNGALESRDRTYHITDILTARDISTKREEAGRRLNEMTDALVKHVEVNHQVAWHPAHAKSVFVQYLSKFSIDCLRSYTKGTALPSVAAPSDRDLFIVSGFLRIAIDQAPRVFEAAMIFVKGHMLANALICSDLERIKDKFQHVTFFLDTPLVLQLLGLHGEQYKSSSNELLELVSSLKGRFAVFEHTFEECYRVIHGCEQYLPNPNARGRIIDEMRRQNKTPSDLSFIRASLLTRLGDLNIAKVDTPQYQSVFQINEQELQANIEEDIQYRHDRAVAYDVNSIRSIYALRRGKEPTRIEEAAAVLVTSNSALARQAYEFGRDAESSREVSTVITDFSLANIAWLKSPLKAPNLPQLELMAMCYAAMEPREALWSKYLAEIDKLKADGRVSPDMHAVLRYHIRAKEELMNLTMGSEEDFTDKTVQQIVERIKVDLTKEKDRELDEEKQRTEQASSAARDTEERARILRSRVKRAIKLIAVACRVCTFIVLLIVLIAGSLLLTFWSDTFWSKSIIWNLVLALAILMAFLFGVFNLLLGASVMAVAKSLEQKVQHRLEAWFEPDCSSTRSRDTSETS